MKADNRPSHFWDQFCGQNAAAVFGQFFFRIDLLNHAGFPNMKKFAFRPALENIGEVFRRMNCLSGTRADTCIGDFFPREPKSALKCSVNSVSDAGCG